MARTTKRPEAELTEAERLRLSEARAVVAELEERDGGPGELTELGYEMRLARQRALELAVAALQGSGSTISGVLGTANLMYAFIWKGNTDGNL